MLRAGVFGVNDGLVSNTCLVMGVAGAAEGPADPRATGGAAEASSGRAPAERTDDARAEVVLGVARAVVGRELVGRPGVRVPPVAYPVGPGREQLPAAGAGASAAVICRASPSSA